MSIQTRPLTEQSGGSCDWGGCDKATVAERFSPELNEWLPVCHWHGGRPDAGRQRGKHPRGKCQGCGEERALDAMGNLFLHRFGWDTYPGSRRPPTDTKEGRANG